MDNHIVIAGKMVRVEANWNAILAFLELKGTDSMEALSSVGRLAPSDLAGLMACCINEGQRLDGKDDRYTSEIIGASCTIGDITKFLLIYTDQTTSQASESKIFKKKA